jgi:serine/threonine protein kinase/tetratricopeptide (TPR) repeat protein
MRSTDFPDLSAEPSALRGLTEEQQDRLTRVLDQYLSALADGVPPRPDALLEEHPDLAGPLHVYLDRLQDLHEMAAGFATPAEPAAPSTWPPAGEATRLGDFVLIREIGHGGMGVVYEARQLSLDRRVAVKVLPFAAVLDAKQIARFKHEAQAAAQLHHPNIVPVFAVGVDRGVHYFAMQYVDGQPLDVAIRQLRAQWRDLRRKATTLRAEESVEPTATTDSHSLLTAKSPTTGDYFRAVARLGVQAARALDCAHEHGVVHRDVKPSNLLLDAQGELWVTDFGLARIPSDAALTRTGERVGTMRYMSPEQATGRSVLVDHRTDIYSLGMTLYELLTLCPAFRDDEGAALLRRIEQDDPARPRQLNPQVPPDLENVVWKAIAKLRDERYATAGELADDLQRFLDGVPTVAKRPRLVDRAGKWVRRHRRMVATVVACGALALCGTAASTLLVLQKHAEKQTALEESQRQLRRAEANFRQAKSVVDQFGARMAERLAGIPGAEPLRRELLGETLHYYQGFLEQAGDDPALHEDIAVTYSKIGGITERIGKQDEALAAYRQAAAVCEQMLEREPDSRQGRSLLALCRSNLGLLLARTGKLEEGQRQIQTAFDLQQQLVADDPQEAETLAAWALTQNNLGLLHSQRGATDQAGQFYLAAVKLQRDLLRDRPDDRKLGRNLAGSLNNLSLLHSRDDLAAAVSSAHDALEIRQRLAQTDPDNVDILNELALAFNNLGALHARAARRDQAADSYGQAIRIQRRLVELAPSIVAFPADLAVSYNNLGLLQSQRGDSPAALEAFQQALAIQESLVSRFPQDPDLISSLAGIYNNRGMVLLRDRDPAQALAAFRLAVQHQEQACKRSPSVARFREFLTKHRVNLEHAQRDLDTAGATTVPTSRGKSGRPSEL